MRLFEGLTGHRFEDSLWQAQMKPDYGDGVITVTEDGWRLPPGDTIAVHDDHRAWLMTELRRSCRGCTIVVTHHAPSAMVAGEMTPFSPCFASNMELETKRFQPALWLFGHTHRSAEVRMPGGTLLCNVSIG